MLKLKVRKFGVLALTFDDGPGTRLTMNILNILSKHGAKATFFVLGRQIPGREHIIREIAEQGHQIGSHGYNHLHHWKVSPIRAIKDIKQGWQAIDDVLGVNHGKYLYRPPHGKLNLVSLLYLLLHKIPVFYWTRDLGDTWLFNKRKKQEFLTASTKLAGDVILAHDFSRPNVSVDSFVLETVESILLLTQKNQLRVITASELLNVDS